MNVGQKRMSRQFSETTKGVAIAVLSLLLVSTVTAETTGENIKVLHARASGLAAFVTGANGGAIAVQPAAGKTRVEPLDFLLQHGRSFGIADPKKQLVAQKQHTDSIGLTHTQYQQVHQGVRVFGGVLKIHQNAAGDVLSANGDFLPIPATLAAVAGISAKQAQSAASVVLAETIPATAQPVVERSELVIVDPGWYGDPPMGAKVAYYLILTDNKSYVREAFFVDAHTGAILDQWTLLHTARDRVIIDDTTSTIVRTEGDPATGDSEADQAYDYTGDTYDLFDRGFGRDGMDDAGGVMTAVVRLQSPNCPNAFGGAGGTFFCLGLATDDIVGHEWGHALTDFTADLIYQNQTGQLNEHYSDVWGELVDLYNGDVSEPGPASGTNWPTHDSGTGLDIPNNLRGAGCNEGFRWKIGEGSAIGIIRDMWNPPCNGDPDRANSPLETCNANDNGGVHSGSGIPNHAFAMLVDGKTFNGFTINAIGPIKAAAVWFQALSAYMTPITDFQDAYFSLVQAASDLVGTTPNDPRSGAPSATAFTTADVTDVRNALLAVEMNTIGRCGNNGRVLFTQSSNPCSDRTTFFTEQFESGIGAWTVTNTNPPTPYDWALTTTTLPFNDPGVAIFIEDRNIGTCGGLSEEALHTLQSPPIVLPADADFPMLSFRHFLRSEGPYDGGRVSIQVNGAGWQAIPRNAMIQNPYNGRLHTVAQGNDNPLAGETAWTGAGGVWGTTIVDLASFASPNDSVELRFEFGKNGCAGLVGWYVDDIEVYNCPDCDSNGTVDVHESRFTFTSPPLGNIGHLSPQNFNIPSPPLAGSAVTLTFSAVGDFGANFDNEVESVNIKINGTPVGTILRGERTANCTTTPEVEDLVVDAITFNAAVDGGNALIEMIPTSDVNPTQCDGSSYISVVASYSATGAAADPNPIEKNRYLTLIGGGTSGQEMGIRVVLKDLPPPFDCHNGEVRWVGAPRDVSESATQSDDSPPTFRTAELESFPILFDAGGTTGPLHVYGIEVVPGGEYEFQAFDATCGMMSSESSAPIINVRTANEWGDVVGFLVDGIWTEPNEDVSIVTDCISVINKFSDLPNAPLKSRADLEPDPPDQLINITDVLFCVKGFQGLGYPFGGPQPPCP